MRVPQRKSAILAQTKKKFDHNLTQEKIDRLERELKRLLETDRHAAKTEVQRTQEMGDLSENAAYQEAKWKLRRINGRILSIQDRLKYAVVIKPIDDGIVQIGSTVTIEQDGKERTYQILGTQEVDLAKGRISQNSPLGSRLIGRQVGDCVELNDNKIIIKEIKNQG
jgi:transcription elongation factor GreA